MSTADCVLLAAIDPDHVRLAGARLDDEAWAFAPGLGLLRAELRKLLAAELEPAVAR